MRKGGRDVRATRVWMVFVGLLGVNCGGVNTHTHTRNDVCVCVCVWHVCVWVCVCNCDARYEIRDGRCDKG